MIHTDFQRGFIKAEVVSFDDLVATGSMAAAKAAGKVRIEGKDYLMADGDVVEFKIQRLNPLTSEACPRLGSRRMGWQRARGAGSPHSDRAPGWIVSAAPARLNHIAKFDSGGVFGGADAGGEGHRECPRGGWPAPSERLRTALASRNRRSAASSLESVPRR